MFTVLFIKFLHKEISDCCHCCKPSVTWTGWCKNQKKCILAKGTRLSVPNPVNNPPKAETSKNLSMFVDALEWLFY